MKIDSYTLQRLIDEAKRVCSESYAPYSNFRVGAALLSKDGRIFSGANVESASYGLTICAERNAIFSGVSNGNTSIAVMVIYTPTDLPTAPCGACRQVIREFSTEAMIFSVCDSDERIETSIAELLPSSFGPENLRK